MMKTSELFEKEIGFISNEDLKKIVIDTLDKAPKCIQFIAASSTGKYHPQADLGEGGLVRHIKTVTAICRSLMDSDNFKDIVLGVDFKPETAEDYDELIMYQDCAIASCILHDCCKASDNDEKHITLFDHPILAANLFAGCARNFVTDDNKKYLKVAVPLIYGAIASHMGRWNTSKYAIDMVLPIPKSGLDIIVHLSDYLASRKFIDFNFDVYDNSF